LAFLTTNAKDRVFTYQIVFANTPVIINEKGCPANYRYNAHPSTFDRHCSLSKLHIATPQNLQEKICLMQ
jgi:hypothetical protein